jgi:hypothetical protein
MTIRRPTHRLKASIAATGLAIGAVFLGVLATCQAKPAPADAGALPGDEGSWFTYTIEDGLPSNAVYGGVAIDDTGSVWAGFETEIAFPLPLREIVSRLDGNAWTNFALCGCTVSPLVASDTAYAGTYCPGPPAGAGGGLSAFIDGTWVTFTPTDGMGGSYVRAIAPEDGNRVWVSAGENLYCQNFLNFLDHNGTSDKGDDEWTVYDFGFCSIKAIAIDPNGNRWFGTVEDGIWVLSADGDNWTVYPPEIILGSSDIAFDATGNAWFAFGEEVYRFDGSGWTLYATREEAVEANFASVLNSWKRERVNPSGGLGLWAVEPTAGVWIMREDSLNHRLGVGFYDGEQWSIYTADNSPLGSDYVYGIAVDHQGNVWFGTDDNYLSGDGGLNKFVPTPAFAPHVAPQSVMLEPGQATELDVTAELLRGWVPTVTLSLDSLPPGASAAFAQNPVTPTAQIGLAITTTLGTPLGHYEVTVSATGAGMTHTSTMNLYIVEEVHRSYFPIVSGPPLP